MTARPACTCHDQISCAWVPMRVAATSSSIGREEWERSAPLHGSLQEPVVASGQRGDRPVRPLVLVQQPVPAGALHVHVNNKALVLLRRVRSFMHAYGGAQCAETVRKRGRRKQQSFMGASRRASAVALRRCRRCHLAGNAMRMAGYTYALLISSRCRAAAHMGHVQGEARPFMGLMLTTDVP